MDERMSGPSTMPPDIATLPGAGAGTSAGRVARGAELSVAQLAKATLRRLVAEQREPTPDNYARAWVREGGTLASAVPEVSGAQWAALIERLVRGFERGSRQWTMARKKEGLQRVLDSSRSDVQRLHERLGQLVSSWDKDGNADAVEGLADEGAETPAVPAAAEAERLPAAVDTTQWTEVLGNLVGTLQSALPPDEARAREMADQLAVLSRRMVDEGVSVASAVEIRAACTAAQRLIAQRHQLVDQLAALARELTAGLTELAEDDSWARGQAEAMQARLGGGDSGAALSVRSVRATHDLLAQTRRQQQSLKGERDRARDALKALLQSLVGELGTLRGRTGVLRRTAGRLRRQHRTGPFARRPGHAGPRHGATKPRRAGRRHRCQHAAAGRPGRGRVLVAARA